MSLNGSRICPGGGSSGPPEKCVIWASKYNLGPQIWGPGAPLDPLLISGIGIKMPRCPEYTEPNVVVCKRIAIENGN